MNDLERDEDEDPSIVRDPRQDSELWNVERT